MFSQIKDRKHIEQNFHSVGKVGWDCVVPGESKTLAWGFAMAPHRLRTLVEVLSVFFVSDTLKSDCPVQIFRKMMKYLKI